MQNNNMQHEFEAFAVVYVNAKFFGDVALCCWTIGSSILKSSVLPFYATVTGQLNPDILRQHTALTFKSQNVQMSSWDFPNTEVGDTTLPTKIYQVTQSHIPNKGILINIQNRGKVLNVSINPLNAELNPICYLLALLAPHFLHVSRIRVKSLTLRLLMSYTGCPRRKGQKFGRVFLMLKYTDITQNTYIQSWTVMEIMAREVWNFDSCYTLID